ncbi:sugar nucleotide-binding protein [Candidatus Falkowbacteria bacterium]|nr:sugar nucleotide-binding protein [Candidatus Falkowbacteria bacterium]
MKFYILGGSGFLGGGFAKFAQDAGHEVVTDRVDITNYPALVEAFTQHKPDVVINFAGVRAYPTIDWCEDHKEETVAVNVGGAINFALAALKVGAYPMMMSSGCVYLGGPEKELSEDDAPNFTGSFYSRMRIAMQQALGELPVLQMRIRMPVSMYSHPRNFIDKIASYQKVISIPNSVTLIEDLWPAMMTLTQLKPHGILNMTNDGYLEHSAVLQAYKEVVDPNHEYEHITLEQLQGEGGITKAKRSNCVLCTKKRKSLGIEMPALDHIRLHQIMQTFKESKKNPS